METYHTKNGTVMYKEKVRMPSGKLKTKSFRYCKHAVQWKREMEGLRETGKLDEVDFKCIPFADVADEWFCRMALRVANGTKITYEYALNSNVKPYFKTFKLGDIKLAHVESYISGLLQKKFAPKTVNRDITILRGIFKFAIDSGYIAQSPINGNLHVKDKQQDIAYFNLDEVKALLNKNIGFEVYPIIYLAIHTGMRIGEILGLLWDSVDLKEGRIRVGRTLSKGGYLQEHTKGNKARFIGMSPDVKLMFERLQLKKSESSYVFLNQNQKPYRPDHFTTRNFKKACVRANVRTLKFHALRHSFASHYVMKGESIYDLRALLGHSNLVDTQKYSHLSPEHLAAATRAVCFAPFAT